MFVFRFRTQPLKGGFSSRIIAYNLKCHEFTYEVKNLHLITFVFPYSTLKYLTLNDLPYNSKMKHPTLPNDTQISEVTLPHLYF